MRHRRSKSESGNIGNARSSAHIDKDALATDESCSAGIELHFDSFQFGESGFAHHKLGTAGFEASEVEVDEFFDHFPLAPGDTGHVYFHVSLGNSQTRIRMDERNRFGAVDDILTWQAGDVRARAADQRTFHANGPLALFRQRPGEDFASHPTSDNQIVNLFNVHDGTPFVRRTVTQPSWRIDAVRIGRLLELTTGNSNCEISAFTQV